MDAPQDCARKTPKSVLGCSPMSTLGYSARKRALRSAARTLSSLAPPWVSSSLVISVGSAFRSDSRHIRGSEPSDVATIQPPGTEFSPTTFPNLASASFSGRVPVFSGMYAYLYGAILTSNIFERPPDEDERRNCDLGADARGIAREALKLSGAETTRYKLRLRQAYGSLNSFHSSSSATLADDSTPRSSTARPTSINASTRSV